MYIGSAEGFPRELHSESSKVETVMAEGDQEFRPGDRAEIPEMICTATTMAALGLIYILYFHRHLVSAPSHSEKSSTSP